MQGRHAGHLSNLCLLMIAAHGSGSASAQQDGTIIIVGAGAAGLTAGYELMRNGHSDFVILEASSRWGGRCLEDTLASQKVDMGAGWIHGPASLLTDITRVSAADMDVTTASYEPPFAYYENGGITNEDNQWDDQVFVGSTWYGFFERFILPNVSSKVEYGCVVDTVDYSHSEKVLVGCQGGATHEGGSVIVTASVSVLRSNAITFTPALPGNLLSFLNNIRWSVALKGFIEFSRAFYRPALEIYLPRHYEEEETLFFDATYLQPDAGARHVLGFLKTERYYQGFDGLMEQETIQKLLQELDTAYGDGVATGAYQGHVLKDWGKEQYIQGGWSLDHDVKALISRASFNPRVRFAGEAFPPEGEPSKITGAALSGQEAARTLLGLDPLPYTTSSSGILRTACLKFSVAAIPMLIALVAQ